LVVTARCIGSVQNAHNALPLLKPSS